MAILGSRKHRKVLKWRGIVLSTLMKDDGNHRPARSENGVVLWLFSHQFTYSYGQR